MKKKTALLLLALAGSAAAVNAETALCVDMTDGSSKVYMLSARPTISMEGADMVIRTSGAETSLPRADVKSMRFDDRTDLESITAADDIFRYRDNRIEAPAQQIEIFSISGTKVAYGRDELEIRHLPAGIYIVRTDNKSVKIIKQ